jgi:hypothetical protein
MCDHIGMSPNLQSRVPASVLLASLASIGLILGMLAVPRAAGAHGGEPEIVLKPTSVEAGGTVRLGGENFEDVESVELALVGAGAKVVLGTVAVGDDGHVKTEVPIPAETAAGPYVIEAAGPEGPLASAALTITAPASPSVEASSSPAASASAGPSSPPSAEPSAVPSASAPAGSPSPAPSATEDPGQQPTAGSDTSMVAAVVVIALVAGVGGGIVLARRGRQAS